MKVSCPTCGFASTVPEKMRGRHARCPKCQTRFELTPNCDTPIDEGEVASLVAELTTNELARGEVCFRCPECQDEYGVAETLVGQAIRCRSCSALCRVLAPKSIAPASPVPVLTSSPEQVPKSAGEKFISFNCLHCGKRLNVASKWAGVTKDCRYCGKPVAAPHESQPEPPQPVSSTETVPLLVRLGGVICCVSALAFWHYSQMETTVPVDGYNLRVVNVHLVQQKQTGVTAAIGGAIVGLLMVIAGKIK